MATISKTEAGTWRALVRKRGFPQQIKTFRLKKQAEDWARAVEDEMVRGTFICRAPAEKTTLNQALQRYLLEVSPTKKSGARREASTANALAEELGSYSLVAITSDLVAGYRDKRLAMVSPKTGRPFSAYTVRLELALLSHLFTIAIQEWGMGLTYNPVANIRKPSAPKGRDMTLTDKQQACLLEECRKCNNPFLPLIVTLGIETAMRKGEILGLRPSDVDLERRVAIARDTKNGETRVVPLTPTAVNALRAALEDPFPRPKNCDLIFYGETGGRYNFEEAWERARNRAGLPDLRFHDLRHVSVSRLVKAGLPDQVVAAISGHKTMQMLKRYTHLRGEDLVKELDKVTAIASGN